ncbi:MAG: O-antigen ligase family protein [Candidatus Omnitrophica bacterium]|nr:O-antigen ligase family protein [Candidatus Omnitrophota bacterium]
MPLLFSITIFSKSKYLRLVATIVFALLLIPLIFVFSRATWLACVISFILVSCLKGKRSLIIILIVLLIAGFLMPAKVKNRAMTFADTSTSIRVELWDRGIQMFKSSPIVGTGLGMFEKLMYDQKYRITWDSPTTLVHAHNTYIEILAEMGLMGFFAFIFAFSTFLNLFFKLLDRNFDNFKWVILSGLFGSIIASLVLALSSTTFILGLQDAVMFWLLFGVAVGLIRDKSKEIASS